MYTSGGSELPIAFEEEGSLLPRRANTSLLASTLTSTSTCLPFIHQGQQTP